MKPWNSSTLWDIPFTGTFRAVLISVGVSWKCCCAVFAQPTPPTPPTSAPAQVPANPLDAVRYVVYVPPLISDADIRRFEQILTLSDPQRVYLAKLYAEYVEKCSAAVSQEILILDSLSHEAALFSHPGETYSAQLYPKRVSEVRAQEARIADRIKSFDVNLLDTLNVVLTEEQKAHRRRLELRRARAYSSPPPVGVLAARFRMDTLLESLDPSEETLLLADPVLVEYENRITPLMVRLHEAMARDDEEWAHLDVQFREASRSGATEQAASLHAQMTSVRERHARLQLQIGSINDEFATRLALLLPEDVGRAFLATYRQQSYFTLYPDTLDPADLHEAIVHAPSLAEDARAAVELIWSRYVQRYERANQALQDRLNEHRLDFYVTSTFRDSSYRDEMRKLRGDRWWADVRTVQQMTEVLDPQTRTFIQPQLDDYQAKVKRVLAAAEDDSWPPPY